MTTPTVAAELLGANPGPAAHIALLGIVLIAALVIFAIVRRRNKRDAAKAEMHSTLDEPLASPPSTQEQGRDPSTSDTQGDR
ncbi:MAG: hypothetical protein ACYC91_16560 [Solirubrobacteraceae bacterium]